MKILGIIPARFQSKRFPGKALVDIRGMSMVQRVYHQATKVGSLSKVIVATDHQGIFQHVKEFGGKVCITGEHHPSGTDRCYEALKLQEEDYDFVLNIQGDEPFIHPQQIADLTEALSPDIQIATLAKTMKEPKRLSDPNEVKVLINNQGLATYFSRMPLPHGRDLPLHQWPLEANYYRHIGIYAYRVDVLKVITTLPVAEWEKLEGLEQLRWLFNGYKISVFSTNHESTGIDTPEDLEKALSIYKV